MAVSARRLGLSALLLVLSVVAAEAQTQFFPQRCENACNSLSDFIFGLPARPRGDDSKPVQWGTVAINLVKRNLGSTSPPGVGRALGILSTCMYEATTLFDSGLYPYAANGYKKIGLKNPGLLDVAIDGAAYTALETVFQGFSGSEELLDILCKIGAADIETLTDFAYNWKWGAVKKVVTAALESRGVSFLSNRLALQAGSLACQKVIDQVTSDGFDGFGRPLRDGFTPVNLPQERAGITNCPAEMRDLSRWQPLCTPRTLDPQSNIGTTDCNVQEWLAPGAGGWTTYAIPRAGPTDGRALINAVKSVHSNVRGGPPQFGEADFDKEMKEVVDASGNLGDVEKLVAEYWADGPDFASPPGTWFRLGMNAAQSRGMGSKEASQLLLVVGMAISDAGVASWRVKRTYDSVRPLQMVQCGSFGQAKQTVTAWKGPYQGVGDVDASLWQPFQLDTFKTPPFASYVSGHATFSAAAGETLKLFFGSDSYVGPNCKKFDEGGSFFEKRITAGQPGFKAGVTDVPNSGKATVGYSPRSDVILCWDSFSQAFDQSAISRIYGGIHIRSDNTDGMALGIEVGKATFARGMKLFGKSSSVSSVL